MLQAIDDAALRGDLHAVRRFVALGRQTVAEVSEREVKPGKGG